MATIARTAKAGGGTNFNAGQTIDPDEVNTDFNTLFTEVNGALDDGNVETATIPGAKSLRFTEISAPSSPSSNDILEYANDNGAGATHLYLKDSAGAVYRLVRVDSNEVCAHPVGTAPVAAVANTVQTWVEDRNGADTASLKVRTEDSGISESLIGYAIQASDTTERTCTNSATDLCTFTVNIPVGDSCMVMGRMRKTSGAAAAATLGLKMNGSQIFTSTTATSATDQAEDGVFRIGPFRPGITNYTRGAFRIEYLSRVSSSGAEAVANTTVVWSAAIPSAAITSIAVTGNSNNASVTFAVKDVAVYRIAST